LYNLREQWSTTLAGLQKLAKKLNAERQASADAIAEAAAEAWRLGKPVGEKMSHPNYRSSGDRDPNWCVVENDPGKMSTPRGRSPMSPEQDGPDTAHTAASTRSPAHATLPLQECGTAAWCIAGIYEHQALLMGLRCLDEAWAARGRDAQHQLTHLPSGLRRAKLIEKLLGGIVTLQAVTGNDIATAQCDLQSLSVQQLLRLRVKNLDVMPVLAVGSTHEVFLTTLDRLLFQKLGNRAVEKASAVPVPTLLPSRAPAEFVDEYKVGREAVLYVAASVSLTASPWWSWWVTDERRIFFNAERFESSVRFPTGDEAGVLQVADFSKAEKHESKDRYRRLDWRIQLISDEACLSNVPLRGQLSSNACTSIVPGTCDSVDEVEAINQPPTAAGSQMASPFPAELSQSTVGRPAVFN
jgi:hypothetical protein